MPFIHNRAHFPRMTPPDESLLDSTDTGTQDESQWPRSSSFSSRPGVSQVSPPVLPEKTDDPLAAALIGVADVSSRLFVTHPCTVLRRQCQVHQHAKSLHLTPFTLVPVVCNMVTKEGVLTFWKGSIGTCVVWGLSNVTEMIVADLFGLPRTIVPNGSSEKYWRHLILKAFTSFFLTPFSVSSFTETVRSEAGLGVEDNRAMDVLVKGVDRMRFFFFGARDSSRRFSILHLALPTTIFGTVHYAIEHALHRQFFLMAKRYINRKPEAEKSKFQQFVPLMFARLSSSVLTDLILFPFETVLHRMYIQGTRTLIDNLDTGLSAVSITVKYSGFFDCLKTIIETEGFWALYSGVGALALQYMLHYGLHQLARVVFDRGSEVLRRATENHPIVTPPLSTNTSFNGPLSNIGSAPMSSPFVAQPVSPVASPRKPIQVASPPRDPTQFPTFGESVAAFNSYGAPNFNTGRPNVFGSPPRSHRASGSPLPPLSLSTADHSDPFSG